MGAAFLLLETKSVVQFALLFGTTWSSTPWSSAGSSCPSFSPSRSRRDGRRNDPDAVRRLVGILLVAWLLETRPAAGLPPLARFIAATRDVHTVFLGNLIFAERFARSRHPRRRSGQSLGGDPRRSARIQQRRARLPMARADGRSSVQRRVRAVPEGWAIATRARYADPRTFPIVPSPTAEHRVGPQVRAPHVFLRAQHVTSRHAARITDDLALERVLEVDETPTQRQLRSSARARCQGRKPGAGGPQRCVPVGRCLIEHRPGCRNDVPGDGRDPEEDAAEQVDRRLPPPSRRAAATSRVVPRA